MRDRRNWFAKLNRPHSVLWWIPVGHRPSVAEAEHRLDLLRDRGPTPDAFTFAALFSPLGHPVARGEHMDRECGV